MERNKNLISISGRIGSGKDTVGKIIQYLEAKNEAILDLKMPDRDYWINISFEDYFKHNMIPHKYKIVKFANTLKDIVCLLIGCTKEQLEDQDFKNKELGKEWWVWLETSSYSSDSKLYSYSQYPTAPSFPHCSLIKLTPRMLLQEIGTQLFRKQLHPQIWVNSLFSKYNFVETKSSDVIPLKDGKYQIVGHGEHNGKIISHNEFVYMEKPKWIITDCRFKNELEAVKQRGGITIRVNTNRCGVVSNHPSETDLDNATFDYLIDNSGSIEDLIDKVKGILIKEGII